jgi:hypothetical protein
MENPTNNHPFRFLSVALFGLILTLDASPSAFGAANIVILNNDAAGVGFNDTTPVAPVGGNPGTTLGQQRLNAFQAAANIWGATLTSSVTITIRAQWTALSCTATAATLGSAGAIQIWRDRAGLPFAGTWYGEALTGKLGGDPDPGPEINANFNVNLGQAGCLTGTFFYLGLDNNHGSNIDLVTVLLHEFAHGLGFQTFTNGSTGAQNAGFPTIYDRFLMNLDTGKSWLQMTDAERVTSTLNTNKLGWDGPLVSIDVPSVLTGGADPFGKALLFSPNPFQGGSSVSHWDTIATPNQLMEPAINGDLTHNVTPPSDLTFSELREIGWVTNALPNAIAVTTGNNQSTPINTQFPTSFSVTISPAVAGLTVTFTANASAGGANGTFATTGTRFAIATTNAGGVATAPAFTANGTAGTYTMNATVPGAGTAPFALGNTSPSGTPTPTPSPSSTALGNISTRLRVETGDNVLIGGFIITGTQPKRVILRALGPSLPVAGAISDTVLELRNSSGGLIASNDDWRTDQQAEIIATGIPPSNNLESAIVATIPANNSAYTAIVRGYNNATGIGVVEAYDLDRTVNSKLANISTRGFVSTGDNVMIGGTIIVGSNPASILLRAIGPSLINAGIPNALSDPTLELHDGNGTLIAFNDDWHDSQAAEIIATGIPPTNNLESAILRTLSPGPYTAIVRGYQNLTGVALVEAYQLQ